MLDAHYKTPGRGLLVSLITDEPIYEFYSRILVSILLIFLGIITHRHFVATDFKGLSQKNPCKSGNIERFSSVSKHEEAAVQAAVGVGV